LQVQISGWEEIPLSLLLGVNVSTSARPGTDPVADAIRAEELGFDFVSASDHLHGQDPTFETWTMLSWIAARTIRIRIASRVLGVPYRPPAMVAKMAETLDRLSAGRLILGLGGGSSDEEFRAFGLGTPSPAEKIAGLEDTIRITRGLWSETSFTYRGRRYHTEAAPLEPKPAHHIPIWLGTFGPRALDLTGRLADGWIPTYGMAPPDQVRQMRDRVLAAAAAAGRTAEEITCIYNLTFHVGDTRHTDPSVVSGPPGVVAERLIDLVGLGFSGMNFIPARPDDPTQVERLANEVLHTVRSELRSASG
jgi:alkanesulfonate monooxygenase SsuD/methylene tetrahydromethanopterin reductase-like flavin-dependent oxidoreductase (luciferase family)